MPVVCPVTHQRDNSAGGLLLVSSAQILEAYMTFPDFSFMRLLTQDGARAVSMHPRPDHLSCIHSIRARVQDKYPDVRPLGGK